MKFTLIPDNPFSNISTSPAWVIHPMRGSTEDVKLAARMSNIPETSLTALKVGEQFTTQHGVISRTA